MITKEFVLSKLDGEPRTNALGEVRIDCPECDDNKGHMYCNLNKGVYICHRCGAKGKIINETKFTGFTPTDTNNFNISEIIEDKIKQIKNLPLNKLFSYENQNYGAGMIAPDYLEDRGIFEEDIKLFDIRLSIEKSGPYKDTIIFPIYDYAFNDKKLKYFVCRRYTNQEPKYVNAPWPKENTLFQVFPFHRILGSNGYAVIIITEGIFDAIAVSKTGYSAISILGKRATTGQLEEISRYASNNLVILLDRDAFSHAVKLKLELDNIFNGYPRNITILNSPYVEDAGDFMKNNDINKLKEMIDVHCNKFGITKES
jgi:DNA primase